MKSPFTEQEKEKEKERETGRGGHIEIQKLVWHCFAQKPTEILPVAEFRSFSNPAASEQLSCLLQRISDSRYSCRGPHCPSLLSHEGALSGCVTSSVSGHEWVSRTLSDYLHIDCGRCPALNYLSCLSAVDSAHDELAFVSLRGEDVIDHKEILISTASCRPSEQTEHWKRGNLVVRENNCHGCMHIDTPAQSYFSIINILLGYRFC